MFNSLTGVITEKLPQKVCIDTHGIEWDVIVPETSVSALPSVGQTGKLYVWMQHTDTAMALYGFSSDKDRMLFFDLLKVEGIGPKGAVKIMGSISPSDLVRILDEGNLDALQKVPGVGKKTAGKMLLQLKGKLSFSDDNVKVVRVKEKSKYEDIVLGLVGMGYERRLVEEKIHDIALSLEKDESFMSMSQTGKEDAIFRRALVELAQ